MPPNLSIIYDVINEENTFTSGDVLRGQVVLELSKETKIDKLYIKCKGEANVEWKESHADDTETTYSDRERYFKLKQIFIRDGFKPEKNDGATIVSGEIYNNLVAAGTHIFPFTFQLPERNMPPTFKGEKGQISYILEARLRRAWKMRCIAKQEFTFVPKIQESGTELIKPLAGKVEKKMKLFTSGKASMNAVTDKMGYMQGEIIKVKANIENSSSRDLKLKYKLEQKQTFTAQSSYTHSKKVIFKLVGDPIPSKSKRTVTRELQTPRNLEPTLTNCRIIKVEYILKVYLDVPYATDPEILFPLIILPAYQYFPSWQNQHDFRSNEPQNTLDLYPPPAAAFAQASNFYPTLYNPQPLNPEAPPPSYTDIYPNSSELYPFPSALTGNIPFFPANDCPPYAAPYTTQKH